MRGRGPDRERSVGFCRAIPPVGLGALALLVPSCPSVARREIDFLVFDALPVERLAESWASAARSALGSASALAGRIRRLAQYPGGKPFDIFPLKPNVRYASAF